MSDLNIYVKKSHIKAVEKLNEELQAWAKETGDDEAVLYEDANTSFTLSDLRVEEGCLRYRYDGKEDRDTVVFYDDDSGSYYETAFDGIMESVHFWRACLRRAKRYWAMDPDKLDRIQDGEEEDINEEED